MINMQQLSQMLLALFIGFCGSVLFIFLHLPLPWLLGAIFTTSIAMRFEKLPIQNPKMFSAPARIFIGLIIGSAFTPEILEFLHIYLFSILLIIPYSIIVTFAGMYYYVKVLKFDRKTAFFSSTPGGVVEMVILGEEQKADTAKRPVEKYDFKAFGEAIKAARTERKESHKKFVLSTSHFIDI
jgi:membrane AbrB-like protein